MAATQVFGSSYATGGFFKGWESTITIAGFSGDQLMAQNWELSFTQNSRPVYSIGSKKVWYSLGQPTGQLRIGRIVGSANLVKQFKNPCTQHALTISAGAGGCTYTGNGAGGGEIPGGAIINLKGVILASVGYSGSVEYAYVMENCGFMFTQMTLGEE